MRILFLVMSAVHRADSVDQLARSLAQHRVLVHHDYSQTPGFVLTAPNVDFVPEPTRTGWGDWGFTRGIFHGLRHALQHHAFDYLQLLSPSCLPIKPLRRFEQYLESTSERAHFDYVDLLDDPDALMSAAYRALAARDSWPYRLMFRLSRAYFGQERETRDVAGLQLSKGSGVDANGHLRLRAKIALQAMRGLSHRAVMRRPFGAHSRLCFGSVWFGAHRSVVTAMLGEFDRPETSARFSRVFAADEFVIPSILAKVCPNGGPMNHLISPFVGARPRLLDEDDIGQLRDSRAFFARKFIDDPAAPSRLQVLAELANVPAWGLAPP